MRDLSHRVDRDVVRKDQQAFDKVREVGDSVEHPAHSLSSAGEQPDASPAAAGAREQARGQASADVEHWNGDIDSAGSMHGEADKSYQELSRKDKLDAIDAKLDKVQRELDVDRSVLQEGIAMRAKGGGGPDDLTAFEGTAGTRLFNSMIDHNAYQADLNQQKQAWGEFRQDLESGAIRKYHDNTGRAVDDGRSFIGKARSSVGGAQGSEGFQRASEDVRSGRSLRERKTGFGDANEAIDKTSAFDSPAPAPSRLKGSPGI